MADLQDLADAAFAVDRMDMRYRWVMDRASYDRLRAETVTEEQETARAQAHATAWIKTVPPYACRVCPAGPFGSIRELTDHVIAMADPANREPDDHDCLFGIYIEVREGGGEPHLEAPWCSG